MTDTGTKRITPAEFEAAYPFETRKACATYIKQNQLNAWCESGRLGSTERFRIRILVGKPNKAHKEAPKRVTAASICLEIYERIYEKEGEVERDAFVKACSAKGINLVTARTRYADIKRELGHNDA